MRLLGLSILLFFFFYTIKIPKLSAETDNQNTDIISFVDSLSKMLCPSIKEELRVKPFDEFVKLQIDTTKFDRECLNNFHNFYNYFYSLDNLEEKYLEYYNIIGLAGRSADLPLLIEKVNLRAVYTIIQGEKFNYSTWHKIYKVNFEIIDKQYDSLSILDTLYRRYIPKDIEEAARICISQLSQEDIKRISQYHSDEDCFWSELELSGKIIRKEFLLFLRPRLTKYFEERINTGNPFVISGLIIVNSRNLLKREKFDFVEFYQKIKDFDVPFNVKPIKGKKALNFDDRE